MIHGHQILLRVAWVEASAEERIVMKSNIDALSEFIRREIGYDGTLDADMDLLEAHVLDSFNIVQLADVCAATV